tara:strand:- start:28 stop:549 length:522 start_codon:yes stop_codon:yes gene_type:complete
MINFVKDIFLRYKLNKRLKILELQSKGEIKSLDSMIILTSNNEFDENIFFSLAKSLKISTKKITLIVISDKKLPQVKTKFGKIINLTKEKVGLFGTLDKEMHKYLDKKFDLLINYFSFSGIFPEYISASCSSKLRLGFYGVNHKISDIVFNINVKDKQAFLSESINYLNSFLK